MTELEKDVEMMDGEEFDDELDYEEEDVIVLTLDDDTELECIILDIFPYNEKEYIALLPIEDDERILLYEYRELESEDDVELSEIETEEEFDAVAAAYDRILEEAELDEDHDHEGGEE